MEAVTAVKIQTVYDNPLNAGKPLTEIANNIKNAMSKGPPLAIFSVKTRKRNTASNITANPNAILYPLILFMKKSHFNKNEIIFYFNLTPDSVMRTFFVPFISWCEKAFIICM